MKTLVFVGLLVVLGISDAFAASAGWEDDYRKALATASQESKHVLVNFTGSDSCLPCMKMKANIFSKKEFREFAEQNLVLMEVDFPRKRHLPFHIEIQNQRLAKDFGVVWFPAIFVLSPEGKRLVRYRYMEGGPDRFIATIKKSMRPQVSAKE